MARVRLLNSYLKLVICALGMACMGYLLYPAIWSGDLGETIMIARALVFLGFTIFLIRGIIEITRGSSR